MANEEYSELVRFIGRRFDGLGERLKKVEVTVEENRTLIRTVAEAVTGVERTLEDFRSDVDRRFRERREVVWSSHGYLDRRVTALEGRVDRLEGEERS